MIELILDECLEDIRVRHASIAECLARYPEHARELEPLLEAAAAIVGLPDAQPSADFKQATRAWLLGHKEACDKPSDSVPGPGPESKDTAPSEKPACASTNHTGTRKGAPQPEKLEQVETDGAIISDRAAPANLA